MLMTIVVIIFWLYMIILIMAMIIMLTAIRIINSKTKIKKKWNKLKINKWFKNVCFQVISCMY